MENRASVTSKRSVLVPLSALTSAVGLRVTEATGQSDSNTEFGLDQELPSGIEEAEEAAAAAAAVAATARNSTAVEHPPTESPASLRLELSSIQQSQSPQPRSDISFGSVHSRDDTFEELQQNEPRPQRRNVLLSSDSEDAEHDGGSGGAAAVALPEIDRVGGGGATGSGLGELGGGGAGGDAGGGAGVEDVASLQAKAYGGARPKTKSQANTTASLNKTLSQSVWACECGFVSTSGDRQVFSANKSIVHPSTTSLKYRYSYFLSFT